MTNKEESMESKTKAMDITSFIKEKFHNTQFVRRPDAAIDINIVNQLGKIWVSRGIGLFNGNFLTGKPTKYSIDAPINSEFILSLTEEIRKEYVIHEYEASSYQIKVIFKAKENSNKFNTSCDYIAIFFAGIENEKGEITDISWIHDLMWEYYYEEIKETASYLKAYKQYYKSESRKYIRDLDKETMLELLSICSEEELKNLLQDLSDDRLTTAIETTGRRSDIQKRVLKPQKKF